MRIPVVPLAVVAVLAGGAVVLFMTSSPPPSALGPPVVGTILDVDGIETEVAVTSDGQRYALIASGDLWFVDMESARKVRLTHTPEHESTPAWGESEERITFTRGDATLEIAPDGGMESTFLPNATDLASGAGRVAFVRDRALWIASRRGTEQRELVPADPGASLTIQHPRFSPDGSQILFVRTAHHLHGEVWRVDIASGDLFPVIADRAAENPSSAEWLADGQRLVYLTDRGGGLAVWYVDLDESTLVPLTGPMMGRSLAPLGIDVAGDRIFVPHHMLQSEISTSDGETLVGGSGLHMEPAVSADRQRVVYTVENQGVFELWALDRGTGESRFVAVGRAARFSPDGNEIVYAATNLDGNRDIWKADIRTGLQEPLTDDDAIDDLPDWSPDGRTVVFMSHRDGFSKVWTVPSGGGRRQELVDNAFAPRFSPDGTRVAYWQDGTIWASALNGANIVPIGMSETPTWPVWTDSGVAFFSDGSVHFQGSQANLIWPEFEDFGDGRWLVSRLTIQATELRSLDLTFITE